MKHLLSITFAILSLPLLNLQAQDKGTASEASSALISPTGDIKAEILKLKLAPLTVEDLAEEATHWQDSIKVNAEKVADAAVRSAQAETGSEAKKAALNDLAKAREVEKALLANFEVILDEWETKGGDAASMRLYGSALNGAKVDIKDTSAVVDSLNRWLKSEDGALKWTIKITVCILILIAAWIVSGLVEKLVNKAMARHKGSSELLDRFVEKIVRRTILALGALVALSTLGVQIGPVLALLGGGAFVIGFALQDTLSNFANGVMLLIYQPFDVGDAVEVGGISGTVDSVSLVNTTIRTFDNKIVLVPNKSVWGQTITNINGAGERRVDMVFGIGYGDDIDKAQSILEKIVSETEGVLAEPETTIRMNELADSSVNFVCRPWAKSEDYWAVYWTVTKRVKEEFDKEGISIPFPQQDVYMHQVS
ncbi:MAG: mechanosensitive ion channel family protein [Akkermansiaceae bacterium]